MTLIVAQRPHTRTFGLCMELNVGMRDGGPHVAHLVEHLVLSRMSKLKARTDYLNGLTHFTKTRYFMSAHLEELDSGLEMMKSVLAPLEMEEAEVKREIGILAREFSEAGIAQMILDREHYRVLGGDELALSYRKALDGVRLSIRAKQANKFHATQYQPRNSVIAIVSPLEPGRVIEKISRTFEGIENNSDSVSESDHASMSEPKKRFHAKWYRGMASVCVWHKMLCVDFSDRVALTILSRILSGTGRLFEELRVKNSLCYQVHENFEIYDDTFWHLAFVNVAPNKARQAVKLLKQVLESTGNVMPRDEFENEITISTQLYEAVEEDKWGLLVGLLNWSDGGEALVPPHEVCKAVRSLTAQQVADVANRFFSNANQHWFLSGCFGPTAYMTTKRLSAK